MAYASKYYQAAKRRGIKSVTVKLDTPTYDRIKAAAKGERRPMSSFFTVAALDYITRLKAPIVIEQKTD